MTPKQPKKRGGKSLPPRINGNTSAPVLTASAVVQPKKSCGNCKYLDANCFPFNKTKVCKNWQPKEAQPPKIPEKRNEQIVLLYTDDGTASDDEMLMKVWEERLKKCASHYKVVVAHITKKRD